MWLLCILLNKALRVFIRKICLTYKSVPVYFYSASDISRIFNESHLEETEHQDIGILTVRKAVSTK
jgi:hypothetical protein